MHFYHQYFYRFLAGALRAASSCISEAIPLSDGAKKKKIACALSPELGFQTAENQERGNAEWHEGRRVLACQPVSGTGHGGDSPSVTHRKNSHDENFRRRIFETPGLKQWPEKQGAGS